MKIKPWVLLLIIAVVIWLIVRRRDRKQQTESSVERSPAGNLAKNLSLSEQAADVVHKAVQAIYNKDLYEREPVYQDMVRPGDFIYVKPQSEKILVRQADGKKTRKRDHSWWPNVMHETNPPWNTASRACGCGCGTVELVIQ